jgi:hypothetical protein
MKDDNILHWDLVERHFSVLIAHIRTTSSPRSEADRLQEPSVSICCNLGDQLVRAGVTWPSVFCRSHLLNRRIVRDPTRIDAKRGDYCKQAASSGVDPPLTFSMP